MWAWLEDNWNKLKDFIDRTYAIVSAWVRDRLGDTVAWLRNERDIIVNAVNSWIDYLQRRISDVATVAWNNLISKWNEIRASITGWLNEAKQWAVDRANDVRNYVVEIRNWLISVHNEFKGWTESVFREAWVRIDNASNSVRNWVQALINSGNNWFNARIDDVRRLLDEVNARFQGSIDSLWSKINNFQFPTFTINASVIWAYVEGYFTAWFEWWLAVLFWHGKSALPPKPTLIGGGSSGGIGNNPPGGTGAQGFIWPVSSRYISGYTFNSEHKGVDIGINTGDPVWAIQSGIVVNAGWSDVGYGFMVKIAHPGNWYSLYAHLLQPVALAGQSVVQGQMIGIGDSTGHSTGPHLHLEIFNGSTYYDPLTLLP